MVIVTFHNLFHSIKSPYTCAINLPQTLKHSVNSFFKKERETRKETKHNPTGCIGAGNAVSTIRILVMVRLSSAIGVIHNLFVYLSYSYIHIKTPCSDIYLS